MSFVVEFLIAALIVVGGAFALTGSWGLVRLPTLMERLHGPTKATTLGLGGLLVASVVEWNRYGLIFLVLKGAAFASRDRRRGF